MDGTEKWLINSTETDLQELGCGWFESKWPTCPWCGYANEEIGYHDRCLEAKQKMAKVC